MSCEPLGAECLDDPSCCMAMPPVHCKPDGPGIATKHCQQDPPKMCHADGMVCMHAADCCGGFCLVQPMGMLTCSSQCRNSGEACASAVDCCSDAPMCAAGDAGLECVIGN
ncbi:MAG TPA: hypothetical protein VGI10_18555 [Polyangiaceae bacterium]